MVSIIVTHKKGINYLRDTFESIDLQEFQDYETILVIDGEEDDPSALIKEYENKIHLKVFRLEGKHGVSAARNYGMDHASGEFIYFLDGDDYLYGDAIGKLVSVMTEDDDLAYGDMNYTWFHRKAFNDEQKNTNEDNDGDEEAILKEYPFEDIYEYCFRKYSRLKAITVLGVLYRKSFLEENQIRFDEDQIYYADAPFFTKVLSCLKSYKYDKEAIYVKRYHNDKEQNPSINQVVAEDREEHYIASYRQAIDFAGENQKLKSHLELVIGKYFVKFYSTRFRWDPDPKWENERLVPFQAEIAKTSKKSVKELGLFDRILLNQVRKNNVKKIKKWATRRMFKNKLFRIIKNKRQFYRAVNLHIFHKFSMKDNWVIFESFVGRNYSGQPKYVYQYMQKEYGNKFRYMWIVDKKGIEIDGKHTKVKRFGLKYFYYMTRSKYWVNNMRQPTWLPRREGQIMLETWHGTPLKRLVFDMDDVHAANPHYKSIVYKQSREWDYLLSDNPFSTEKFQSCFRYEKEKILELGYPANDPLYAPDLEERSIAIKKKLGIPLDKKVLLYAPTWRDDSYYDAGEYKFDLALDLDRMRQEFEGEYVILLRMHYWIVDKLDLSKYPGFVYNGSNYDDITELYMISDICMTDYSSVFFDYANLKRPILYYTYDLEKYRDVLRGFYLDVEKDLPGPLLLTNDEVVEAIKNIDQISAQYKDKYDEFYDRFCCIDDGHAAERVVKAVFEK